MELGQGLTLNYVSSELEHVWKGKELQHPSNMNPAPSLLLLPPYLIVLLNPNYTCLLNRSVRVEGLLSPFPHPSLPVLATCEGGM